MVPGNTVDLGLNAPSAVPVVAIELWAGASHLGVPHLQTTTSDPGVEGHTPC
jgi:hypothetical protein